MCDCVWHLGTYKSLASITPRPRSSKAKEETEAEPIEKPCAAQGDGLPTGACRSCQPGLNVGDGSEAGEVAVRRTATTPRQNWKERKKKRKKSVSRSRSSRSSRLRQNGVARCRCCWCCQRTVSFCAWRGLWIYLVLVHPFWPS